MAWGHQLILVATVYLVLMGLVASDDLEQKQRQHSYYCEMLAIWQANKHLPPEHRPGWPPYRGECDGRAN